jgi:hypothetical protein
MGQEVKPSRCCDGIYPNFEIMQDYRIHLRTTVPRSPWQNCAEACICELKKYVDIVLHLMRASVRLWTYCAMWCAEVRRFTASSIPKMMGIVPETQMTGSTPEISALILFDWYHLVCYLTPSTSFSWTRSSWVASLSLLKHVLTRWRFTSSARVTMSSFARIYGTSLTTIWKSLVHNQKFLKWNTCPGNALVTQCPPLRLCCLKMTSSTLSYQLYR